MCRALYRELDVQQTVNLGRRPVGTLYHLPVFVFRLLSIAEGIVRMSEESLTSQDKEEVSEIKYNVISSFFSPEDSDR